MLSGLGLGLIFGFSLAEEQNQNPPSWLAMLPVFLFGIGAFFVGRFLAKRDDRGDPLDQPNEP